MSTQAFEIKIPETPSGRLYVGLSWDDIYDSVAAKELTKEDVKDATVSGLMQQRFIIAYIVFVVLFTIVGQLIYTNLLFLPFNWMITLGIFVLFNVAYAVWIRDCVAQGGILFFLDNREKEEDLEGRDTDYQQLDMDLHCFVYNQNKEFLFEIDPMYDKALSPDTPPSVYHSGEEATGGSTFDDETICVETKKVQDDYCYYVFAVANDCAHDFDKVNDLKVRLVDSKSEQTLHQSTIDSNDGDGYIYCCLYKDGEKWLCKTIDSYVKFDEQWKDEMLKVIQEL